MPYPLQFLDQEINIFADSVAFSTIPLTVGSDYEPGDMRVCMVWAIGSMTASSFPGFTSVSGPSAPSGAKYFIFTKVFTGAPASDSVLTFSAATTEAAYAAYTVRNPNVGQSFTSPLAFSAAGGSGSSIVDPSTTVAANSSLICFNYASSASIPITSVTPPAGWTTLGSANLDNPNGSGGNYFVQLIGKGFSSSGSSGTVTSAVLPAGTVYQYATAPLLLIQNPDIASTLTAAAETDAGVAVTSALATTATNVITPAQEVDIALEVYNPLQAVSIRPPVLLTNNPVSVSRVSWSASTPAAGSAVLVETSLDGGASWQTAINGGAVPGLLRGDTTTPVVLTRATMTRLLATDASPFFMTLRTDVAEDTSYNELVALGTFLITQVDVTETGGPTGGGTGGGGGGNGVTGTGGSSVGGGLSLVVSGIDLSYAISRNAWTSIFYVPSNTNYATAMLEIAQNRLPGITSDVASTEVTAERLLFGTSQGADAWQDIQDMGTAIGSRAYFDSVGTFKVKPVADPALTPSVWTVSDAANPVMVSYTRSISDSTTYNYVVVSGESTSNEVPVSAVAFDADPSSPTYYLGPYNIVTTTFISAMITTPEQAQQAADALLLVVKGASETVEITMVPNPALEPNDVITVARTFNGQKIIQGTFKINSMSTPIGQAQAQVLVCYRQSAAQG